MMILIFTIPQVLIAFCTATTHSSYFRLKLGIMKARAGVYHSCCGGNSVLDVPFAKVS
jgi:hypothetical protein